MPFAVDREHQKFFRLHHYIAFDGLLTPEECLPLEKEGALEYLKALSRRRQLAEIAFGLTGKRPWRLLSIGSELVPVEEEQIGLLMDLRSGQVIYFEQVNFPLPEWYCLVVLTTRFQTEERHPMLFR